MTTLPQLPTSIWEHALDWLPMADALNCSVANSLFLHEVSPLIRTLRVQQESNIFGVEASKRFPSVDQIWIDFRIAQPMKVVLFLLRFPQLKRVHFAPTVYDSSYEGNHIASELIRTICHAYSNGNLNERVILDGLIPLKAGRFSRVGWQCFARRVSPQDGCAVCRLICRSFPPLQLLEGRMGSACCMPIESQMKIAFSRTPRNVNLSAILGNVLKTQKQVHHGILCYSKNNLQRMDWLVQKGAQFSKSDLSSLLLENGVTGVDQLFFEKLCDWELPLHGKYLEVKTNDPLKRRQDMKG